MNIEWFSDRNVIKDFVLKPWTLASKGQRLQILALSYCFTSVLLSGRINFNLGLIPTPSLRVNQINPGVEILNPGMVNQLNPGVKV